jgi:hypothetical protein
MKTTNLKQQLDGFKNGLYLDSEGNNNECFNFYDWFCKDKSLKNKAYNLFRAADRFVEKFKVDTNTHYVFFKNNCPMRGSLYDSFSICDIDSGDVMYWVTPKSGHTGLAEICIRDRGFDKPLTGGTLSEIYKILV